jgi:hypothetical protein
MSRSGLADGTDIYRDQRNKEAVHKFWANSTALTTPKSWRKLAASIARSRPAFP